MSERRHLRHLPAFAFAFVGLIGHLLSYPSSTGPGGVTPPSEGGIPLSILAVMSGAVLLFAGVFLLGRGSDQRGGR
jgi:hypothetical protein